jgi:ribonuclease HI
MPNGIPKQKEIHLFVDGSSSEKPKMVPSLGAGWIATVGAQQDVTPVLTASVKIDQLPTVESALFAEVKAASLALRSLPMNSYVIVHSDRDDIRRYINILDQRRRMSRERPQIAALFSELAKAIKRHRHVEASWATPSIDFSNVANNLAVMASGSKNIKRVHDFEGIIARAKANEHLLHRAA